MKAAAVASLSLLLATGALARGIVVSPPQLGLAGNPGQAVSGIISVSSARGEATQIRASIVDFVRDLDGKLQEVPPEQSPRSCRPWMSVDQREFAAPLSGSVPVAVTIRIPEDAGGSYWAAVRLTAVPSTAPTLKRGVALQVVPSIVVPVVVTVSGPAARITLKAGEVGIFPRAEGAPLMGYVVVENSGTTAVLISGALALERPFGNTPEELASVDVGPVTSLPGTKLKVRGRIPWTTDPAGLLLHAYLRYGPRPEDGLEASATLRDMKDQAEK